MRRDRNERARQDAFLYIASWRDDWDELSFFASGEADYQNMVAPILQRLALDPSDKSMAEIGCGAGRMTRSFASRFREVSAVDISEEMQARARAFLSSFSNITWILSDGQSDAYLPINSLDFVFSYLVLQHLSIARTHLLQRFGRCCAFFKPGGAFLFQFNGSHQHTYELEGAVCCPSSLDTLTSIGLTAFEPTSARGLLGSIRKWSARPGGELLSPPLKSLPWFVQLVAQGLYFLPKIRHWHGATAASGRRHVRDHSWP